jgi:hypothetical protein
MKIPLPGLTVPLIILVVLIAVVWIGLRLVPAPFAAPPVVAGTVQTIPLPGNLPAPVTRFYRAVYGERIPVIHTVVMTGRAEIRPFGRPTLHARFRFVHDAGRSYRHYIEATFFGLPIMRVNESFIDGHSRYETPAGVEEGEPRTQQGANLGMWAELSGAPAVLLTDPRVRWIAVDDEAALLEVPYQGVGRERFMVRFDQKTGLVTLMEVMRFQRKDSPAKTLWVTKALSWEKRGDYVTTTNGSAWWYGADRPWAIFHMEDIVLNADLGGYLEARGR